MPTLSIPDHELAQAAAKLLSEVVKEKILAVAKKAEERSLIVMAGTLSQGFDGPNAVQTWWDEARMPDILDALDAKKRPQEAEAIKALCIALNSAFHVFSYGVDSGRMNTCASNPAYKDALLKQARELEAHLLQAAKLLYPKTPKEQTEEERDLRDIQDRALDAACKGRGRTVSKKDFILDCANGKGNISTEAQQAFARLRIKPGPIKGKTDKDGLPMSWSRMEARIRRADNYSRKAEEKAKANAKKATGRKMPPKKSN